MMPREKKKRKFVRKYTALLVYIIFVLLGFCIVISSYGKYENLARQLTLSTARAAGAHIDHTVRLVRDDVSKLMKTDIAGFETEALSALRYDGVISEAYILYDQAEDLTLFGKDAEIQAADAHFTIQEKFSISFDALLRQRPEPGQDIWLIADNGYTASILYLASSGADVLSPFTLIAAVNVNLAELVEPQNPAIRVCVVSPDSSFYPDFESHSTPVFSYDALREGGGFYEGYLYNVSLSEITGFKTVVYTRQRDNLPLISLIIWLVFGLFGLFLAVYTARRFRRRYTVKTSHPSQEPHNEESHSANRRLTPYSDGASGEPRKPLGHRVTRLWFLEKIMLNMIQYENLEDYSKFNLSCENAVVFTVYKRGKPSSADSFDDVLCYMLDNICRDIFPEPNDVFFLELEYKIVGVVLHSKDSDDFFENTVNLLDTLAGHIENIAGLELCFCLSDVHHSIGDLFKAYDEANYTYTYYYIHSQLRRFCYYKDIKVQKCSYLDVPRISEVEKRYIGLISQHEFVKAKQELLALLDTILSLEALYNRVVQTMIFDVIDMTLKGLSILDQNDVEQIFDKFPLISEMLSVDNLGYLRERCVYILDTLIQYYDTKSMGLQDKMLSVAAYIQLNYSNPDMSLVMLSQIFSISVQHLSKNFKAHNGTGVQEYIERVRIDNAKKLLQSNDRLTIAQVASDIGFNSSQTFIRAFKRAEGVTPGLYREK